MKWLAPVLLLTACQIGPVVVDTKALLPPRIERNRVGIVLIDAQPAFWRSMHGPREPVMERIEQLLIHASITETPIVATFEVPTKRNGELPERLEEVWPKHGHRHEKRTFDCCREPAIAETLRSLGVDQVVVAGAETDVCVMQSCLGLRALGFDVFLLEDCIFSNEANIGPALRRMQMAGVVPTTYKSYFYAMEQTVELRAIPKEWRKRLKVHAKRYRSPYGLSPFSSDTKRL
ncbi:MAG: nicotinamidase-related amidase [Planctomycetota bacterium]|jgi:nicotinamidase-related amidase